MGNKYLILGLLVILIMQNISAIGITPGRTTIDFEPNLQREIAFTVINSENKDMMVVFMVRGNLSEYITLSQNHAEFTKDEISKSFTYSINLPSKISTPGKHEVEIVALEIPTDTKEKGSFVGATVAVISQLHIYVPYPNKYAEASINILESEDKKIFRIPVINRGKLDIANLRAIIDIYNGLGEKITSLETETETLNSLQMKELAAEWDTNVNPGKYSAIISVIYDNQVITLEKEFKVGEKVLEILEININDFELGGIAKFNALVENKWSEELKDVYLNIIIYNNEGEVMADFNSLNYNIGSQSKSEMIAYWDTVGVEKGTYDGKIFLKYGTESTEKEVQMKITENSIEVIGLTGHVVVKKAGTFNLNNILLILVIFLILVNVVWFVIVKNLLKKKK
ncbi:MAG: hypothetical protein QT05_C0015G0003 [archaeon GW2011_AR13]|nr:MAG: hypothetical protein QT05_C0015G0003 [archaeon GW2011_AR13]HIH63312.1 hypothetical protein [Nanoarchaeota archaeon]